MDGVGEEDGTPLRVGDGFGDAVEPLVREDTHRCEPRRVRVQRRVGVCVCVCVWGGGGPSSGRVREEELVRVEPDPEGAADQEEGHDGGPERFEFGEAVGVPGRRRSSGEFPADEGDPVSEEIWRKGENINHGCSGYDEG